MVADFDRVKRAKTNVLAMVVLINCGFIQGIFIHTEQRRPSLILNLNLYQNINQSVFSSIKFDLMFQRSEQLYIEEMPLVSSGLLWDGQ